MQKTGTDRSETSVNGYFAWLEKHVSPGTALWNSVHSYLEQERVAPAGESDGAPFLSVVIRTVGNRPGLLAETLLSLTGQSDGDFEVVLIGHNLTDAGRESLRRTVADLPDETRGKIRRIEAHGGTRATPLNVAFEAARGDYIAVLDDDDFAFDHWVEVFHELSRKHPGKLLHAWSVSQSWEKLTRGECIGAPRAIDAPSTLFCENFSLLNELKRNRCPFCSIAFPAYLFRAWGLRFDESLTTTEDWDFIMRCAFLVGVADEQTPTTLYRIWRNVENSSTLHDSGEWEKNYRKIISRFRETPILMPPGALDEIIVPPTSTGGRTPTGPRTFAETEVFYDDGTGIRGTCLLRREEECPDKAFDMSFVPDPSAGPLAGVRVDPQHSGYLTVTDLCVRVEPQSGACRDYTVRNVRCNGYRVDDSLVFLKDDPQILVRFPTAVPVRRVLIRFVPDRTVSGAALERILPDRRQSFLYRAARKVYRFCKTLLKAILRRK